MTRAKILIVEDDPLALGSLAELLQREGYDTSSASDGAEALRRFEPTLDAVLLDFRLPDIDGFTVLRRMRAADPEIPIMMMTGQADVEHAVQAMQHGSSHYMAKPLAYDPFLRWLGDAVQLREDVTPEHNAAFDAILGRSPAIERVRRLLRRIARSSAATVLLTGESGTGKGLAARALHDASNRARKPFMNITCTALAPSLLESELFGHERGAFTDARTRKKGLLELADGGTVFLDEIGDMAPELQAKLLRVLEDRSFRRVGGTESLYADVRIVAATHVDLQRAVAHRSFREDLYYRLAVFVVEIPPLRERAEDLEPLVESFVAEACKNEGRSRLKVTEAAMQRLRLHSWPGNVRELRNMIERAVLLAEDDRLDEDAFDVLVRRTGRAPVTMASLFELPVNGVDLRDLEQRMVEEALRRTGGNITRAARLLGFTRDQMRYRVEKFGISRPDAESGPDGEP